MAVTDTISLRESASRRGFDATQPIFYGFAALLCVLIVLPVYWLFYYSVSDKSGSFTLGNFTRLFSDSTFIDPLVTTLILLIQVT